MFDTQRLLYSSCMGAGVTPTDCWKRLPFAVTTLSPAISPGASAPGGTWSSRCRVFSEVGVHPGHPQLAPHTRHHLRGEVADDAPLVRR